MKLDNATVKERLKAALGLDDTISKIVVVGLGVTGVSVARYLASLEFDFVVADSREHPAGLAELQEEISSLMVFTGEFDEQLLTNASHLIVSPGISLTEYAIQQAINHGVKVLGDIDLLACSINTPVIAITGSNGKSTVTTLLGDMAKAAGRNPGVGGNLGLAALDLLNQEADLYVLELSSFQLERTTQLNAAAATVLNISADHLDRHVDLADYAAQKQRIFYGDGVMVLNADDPIVSAMRDPGRTTLTFSIRNKADFWIAQAHNQDYLMHHDKQLLALAELPLEGRHNAANALAALALGAAIGLSQEAMITALRSFQGLKHRMQVVGTVNGVTWVNDSKATNIGACIAALQGYDRKVVLIAGGDAKGSDMNELVPSIKEKTSCVILMGKDAPLIEQALADCVPIIHVGSMKEAVKSAASVAKNGDTVLLSPACASLDQYKNYQDRGDQFATAVLSLPCSGNANSTSVMAAL
ncbi:MAG: UDP-N-acetylmuramoyl-L-alanine--D-glutamate ligase [Gammaproteobacteria bacterium]|nr:UDP-N-acetylmuramoyl-L-alanine--D-glutamate ligase [Gammaproteobacteria bacterium]